MRARRFLKKTGRKVGANGSETIGFDKTKVEFYNYHKRGHFIREYRAPRENMSREPVRRNVTVETTCVNALMAQDRFGYDWSDQAEDGPTNFALMAYTSSCSSSSDSEARVVVYKKNKDIFEENNKILKLDIHLKDNALTEIRKKLEKAKKEKDEIKITLEKFENSSKTLNKMNFMPPKPDLILVDVDEYVSSEFVTSVSAVATNKAKTSESKPKSISEPLIEDWVSESEDENETKTKSKQRKPSFAKAEFVKPNEQVKSPRKTVKQEEHNRQAKHPKKNSQSPRVVSVNTARQINTAYLRPIVNSARPESNVFNKAHSYDKRHINKRTTSKNSKINQKVNTVRAKHVNTARPKVNTARPKAVLNVVQGNQEKGFIDSGCSRHMTGNMSYLSKYEKLMVDMLPLEETPTENSVFFTDNECVVLSPDFKLLDESQVLLRVLRKNNMYNVDLKNVAPLGGLTCLFANATLDEYNLWQRMLRHINFKTMKNGGGKKDIKDPGIEDNEVLSTEEPRVNQEKDANVNNTNNINTISPTANAASTQDNTVDENIVYRCTDDLNMPDLEEIVYLDDDEDVGVEADMTNSDTNIPVSPFPTIKIHKDHPVEQIIRDIHSAPQTKRITKSVTDHEPKKVIQALTDPSWIEAMQDELLQFKLQQVGHWCIYQMGYNQEEGIDYDEVFAPIARIEAIRLFLAYASFKDFIVYQMDVKSAFLYGKIEEETASTPMETLKPLLKNEKAKDVEVNLYRSMIGSLMYLTSSRPDIMFSVCACARFQVTPKVSHLHAVKRIFKYLKGQPKLGLWYPKDSSFNLEAYTDSDYAGASLDSKSTTGEYAYTYYCQLKVNAARHKLITIVDVNAVEEVVVDEALYEKMYDSVEMVTTTATGLDAKQDRGIISKPNSWQHLMNQVPLGLVQRVKRLERKKKSRSHGLKRFYKVKLSARLESSTKEESLGEEESSKQGRIEDIYADDNITLVNDQEMFDVDRDLQGEEVVARQEKEVLLKEIQDVLNVVEKVIEDISTAGFEEKVSTAAPITTVDVTPDELTMAQALIELKK
nr:ribonuclease H-like domain-containing protein [Tanacetum cinerariifolium]